MDSIMTNTNTHITDLPAGWVKVKNFEISEVNVKPDFSEVDEEMEVSFIPMAAVEERTGRFKLDEVRKFKEVKKGYTSFVNGDIIFAKITPCMENGKIALLSGLKNGIGFGSTEFHTSRFYCEINSQFYFYYFSQEAFRREAKREMTGSAGQLRVPSGFFREVVLPLPPLAEQHRIVAKIEELFSDLDHSVAALEKAREQLKIYRQAVLKYAFEGKLTAQWRRNKDLTGFQNLSGLDSAAELLARIQAGRTKNGKPAKPLPPLTEVELAELPSLPEGWCWVKLGDFTEIVGGVTKGRNLEGKQIVNLPYLRVANVQDGYLDLSTIKYIDALPSDLERYRLEVGDILYTEGGDKDKLGRGTVWKGEIKDCIHQNHVFRARAFNHLTNPYFIAYYSQTQTAKHYFFGKAKQTVNLATINMTVLSNFPVPYPPLEEQHAIVEEIEARLSVIDKLEETIETSLQQAEALRQSILKQAFAGKLVPQDPNDEPAEKLLARIKSQT